jgi:hypothetical protein
MPELKLPPFLNLVHEQNVYPKKVDEEKGPHPQDRKVIHLDSETAVVWVFDGMMVRDEDVLELGMGCWGRRGEMKVKVEGRWDSLMSSSV